ncbi:transcriptional regulator [Moraxella sp. FZLJ2107]|uniref:transcriptional regulator n=1 Tax=unclassified Moraxella TaxID=2685852 RepID=UPI0020C8D228|nr:MULTISPECIES: transcriptional regulator [unclassified Moraxella]UTO04797.1 transcriptional regulator [Moraxella sp. FZLJ2107]UTO21529.1 transcriptional regulator [Moraxella sp. FZLJ2109]
MAENKPLFEQSELTTPIRVSLRTAAKMLDISLATLRTLISNDATFPRPYKAGTARTAGVYIDFQELKNWHLSQLNRNH